jgi:hypothetical protein
MRTHALCVQPLIALQVSLLPALAPRRAEERYVGTSSVKLIFINTQLV